MKLLALFFSLTVGSYAYCKRVGFMVGTYDPPHIGHVEFAKQAVADLQLDQLIIFVNVDTSTKPNASKFEHRYEMTKLAFAEVKNVLVMDSKLTKIFKEKGYVGITEHLASLQKPDDILFSLLGSDILLAMQNGAVKPIIRGNMKLAVAIRSQYETETPVVEGAELILINKPQDDHSSTKFKSLTDATSLQEMVSSHVFSYIKQHKLFQFSNLCLHKLE